ncbi:DNA methylase, N-6 adenine-specific, conserved site [Cinara cedri]|uniref:DNA methylase, N-6 adenine-specific, conserved site n=1 Tax=Cinara cedri TaxID=506608 RepID=A0A5E4NM68_9HEMI|nr:DNA methylase, N-6 adenine-specific, conserved site [Cinara cedri]
MDHTSSKIFASKTVRGTSVNVPGKLDSGAGCVDRSIGKTHVSRRDCVTTGSRRRSRGRHTRRVKGDRPLTCDICCHFTENLQTLYEHILEMHPDAVVALCGVCFLFTGDFPSLVNHVRRLHTVMTSETIMNSIRCKRDYDENRGNETENRATVQSSDDIGCYPDWCVNRVTADNDVLQTVNSRRLATSEIGYPVAMQRVNRVKPAVHKGLRTREFGTYETVVSDPPYKFKKSHKTRQFQPY